jgi:hypothetical protein
VNRTVPEMTENALTGGPFDETGLTVHESRADPVGVLLRVDDSLAGRDSVVLADRRWFRFPEGTDPGCRPAPWWRLGAMATRIR